MRQYGKRKRGSGKLHPHNECAVCSECKPASKKRVRQITKEEIKEEIKDYLNNRRMK
jgi:hypothetical protein